MASRTFHRDDVDGLRAVAVILVILFHSKLGWVSGGYIGVDIFFVISGYVITRAIVPSMAADKFRFHRFWAARARRILPALAVMIAIVFPFCWAIMLPSAFSDFAASGVLAILFLSNFVFAAWDPYLADESALKPLLHTWSLGVEAQFYLVFPIVLSLAMRRGLSTALIATATLSFASLLLANVLTSVDQNASFYLPLPRFWEFGGGTIVALIELQNRKMSVVGGTFLPIVGMIMIVASGLMFGQETHHPGWITLVPVIGTMLVIGFGTSKGPTTIMLSSRIPVAIGLASYSLYLWHQPLLSLYRVALNGSVEVGVLIVLGIALALLSVASWRFVERPFRTSTFRFGRAATLALPVLLIALGWGTLTGASRIVFATSPLLYEPQRGIAIVDGEQCAINIVDDPCIIGDATVEPRYAILGDSHAQTLTAALQQQLDARGESAVVYLMAGCPFILGVLRREYPRDCLSFAEAVMQRLEDSATIQTVIISDYRSAYLSGRDATTGEPTDALAIYSVDTSQSMSDLQRRTFDRLLMAGIRVVYLMPVPDAPLSIPAEIHRRVRTGTLPYRFDLGSYHERISEIALVTNSYADNGSMDVIFPHEVFCAAAGACVTHSDNAIFYTDSNHLSAEGAEFLIEAIDARLFGR